MSSEVERVNDLLALLEQHLQYTGALLTTSRPQLEGAFSHISPEARRRLDSGVPPSLAIYPDVSLETHLEQHEQFTATNRNRAAKISALCLDQSLLSPAHDRLDGEHIQLDQQWRVAGFEKLSVPQKLAALCEQRQRALEPKIELMKIAAVTGLDWDGTPGNVTKYHLPKNASWAGVQEALQTMTTGWRSRESGYPDGYSLSDGAWLYQTTEDDVLRKEFHPLCSESEFHTMRRQMEREGLGIVIWHVILRKESDRLRAEADDIKDVRSRLSDGEPMNKDGTPMFNPTFDPWVDLANVGEIDFDGSLVDLAPDVEPLSEEEANLGIVREPQASSRAKPQRRSSARIE